ncbi:MAG TPA: hypothetical protein PK990_00920, partial [Salinivirgaceae bacterium]|nr:hypothetical protein [Salinivirgaceae bacterium]
YLVFSKDAFAIPALSIIVSFISNAYIVYLGFLLISLLNFKKLHKIGVHILFLALIIPLPFIVYKVYQNFTLYQMGIGNSIDQFQLYLSFFSFFYGIIVAPTITPQKTQAIIVMLLLVLGFQIIQVFEYKVPVIRLIFSSIPLVAAYLAGRNRLAGNRKFIMNFFLWIILIYLFLFTETTFTLLLTSLFCYYLSRIYFLGRYKQISFLTGVPIFLLIFLFMIYAITSYKEKDYREYKKVRMSEIKSVEMLLNRARMKIFEDRSPLWSGAINTLKDYTWGIPQTIPKILLEKDENKKEQEFAYHSHNIFLELPRTLGLLFGTLTSLIFIMIALKTRKYLTSKHDEFNFNILTLSSVTSLIIGSFSGIYPLLFTFAGTTLTICGMATWEDYFSKVKCLE